MNDTFSQNRHLTCTDVTGENVEFLNRAFVILQFSSTGLRPEILHVAAEILLLSLSLTFIHTHTHTCVFVWTQTDIMHSLFYLTLIITTKSLTPSLKPQTGLWSCEDWLKCLPNDGIEQKFVHTATSGLIHTSQTQWQTDWISDTAGAAQGVVYQSK